jgi:hypothetical protein
MSKSEKVHISVTYLLIHFFTWNFLQLFQWIQNKHQILRFIILSKCPYFCLFWGSVQMHSGLRVVNIDFQPLGMKSVHKEGEFWGLKI